MGRAFPLAILFISTTVHASPDWDKAGADAVDLLSGYLRTDTSNPPGNEIVGARYLAAALEREGIASEIYEYAPGRANLVARLSGSGAEAPLCLVSHIDVVPGRDADWPEGRGPFSGAVDSDGWIWGRGALDMKGMGALEAEAFILLKREAIPLRRDVVLLAVADEEVNNDGIRYMMREHWDRIGCSHALNEGGVGLPDMLFPGQTVFPISVGEKGILWARMVATGEPGHGSTPQEGQAPERLIQAVQDLEKRKVRPTYDPALLELLDRAGREHGGLAGAVLRSPFLIRTLLKGQFMGNPLTRATITDTVNVTGFGGAGEPNVVAEEAWANLDCRLLPRTTPASMLAHLRHLVSDPAIRFDTLIEAESGTNPWDDPFFEALAKHVVQGIPGAVAGPTLFPAFTDSIWMRPRGVRAYGLVPFVLPEAELRTMHGNGERVSIENVRLGLRVIYESVVDVAAVPGA